MARTSLRRDLNMEIWLWILGVVAVVAVIAIVVDRRRGPTGSNGDLDFNTTNRSGGGYDGDFNGPMSSGGGGGAGG